MIICKQCRVELEPWMEVCPLCKIPVADGDKATQIRNQQPHPAYDERNPGLLKRIFLQITCVLLLSGILATLIINLAMVGHITWSVYPITLCLIVLSYVFSLGLWTVKPLLRILAGWLASMLILGLVHLYVSGDWPLKLALPILCSINVITMLLVLILGKLKVKGLNMVAILFIGAAVLCLMVEVILSKYFQEEFRLSWSVVVSACLLPVTAVIVFMHFKTRSNADLEKIFHT
jgi:hypothetical protein